MAHEVQLPNFLGLFCWGTAFAVSANFLGEKSEARQHAAGWRNWLVEKGSGLRAGSDRWPVGSFLDIFRFVVCT